MNRVTIMGNLGADPERLTSGAGNPYVRFTVATSDLYGTQWHKCIAFGKTSETIADHLSKGRRILVEGKLEHSSYEREGVRAISTTIVVQRFYFVDSKPKAQEQPEPRRGYGGGGGYSGGGYEGQAPYDEYDDIPF